MSLFSSFNDALFQWFETHQRSFPWRESRDPYLVWVSEVMSQQTQIERVAGGFYPRFVERFPDVTNLAKASWEDVFPLWDGLGYYRRGQNMIKGAQYVLEHFDGVFPSDLKALQRIPGIGPYTASAILCFAFEQKIAALDTNLTQILSALFPDQDLEKTAQKLVQSSPDPHAWNSAMMDLGAALRSGGDLGPLASFFPLEVRQTFWAGKKKVQDPCSPAKRDQSKNQKPKPKSKPLTPDSCLLTSSSNPPLIHIGIACIHRNGQYLIQTRPKGKTWEGYWEFPGGKKESGEDLRACVKREVLEEVGVQVSVRPHFCETIVEKEDYVLVLRFHRCQIQAGKVRPCEDQELQWIPPTQFDDINFLPANKEALDQLKRMRV